MIIKCASCQAAYDVPEEKLGIKFWCKKCKNIVRTAGAGAKVSQSALQAEQRIRTSSRREKLARLRELTRDDNVPPLPPGPAPAAKPLPKIEVKPMSPTATTALPPLPPPTGVIAPPLTAPPQSKTMAQRPAGTGPLPPLPPPTGMIAPPLPSPSTAKESPQAAPAQPAPPLPKPKTSGYAPVVSDEPEAAAPVRESAVPATPRAPAPEPEIELGEEPTPAPRAPAEVETEQFALEQPSASDTDNALELAVDLSPSTPQSAAAPEPAVETPDADDDVVDLDLGLGEEDVEASLELEVEVTPEEVSATEDDEPLVMEAMDSAETEDAAPATEPDDELALDLDDDASLAAYPEPDPSSAAAETVDAPAPAEAAPDADFALEFEDEPEAAGATAAAYDEPEADVPESAVVSAPDADPVADGDAVPGEPEEELADVATTSETASEDSVEAYAEEYDLADFAVEEEDVSEEPSDAPAGSADYAASDDENMLDESTLAPAEAVVAEESFDAYAAEQEPQPEQEQSAWDDSALAAEPEVEVESDMPEATPAAGLPAVDVPVAELLDDDAEAEVDLAELDRPAAVAAADEMDSEPGLETTDEQDRSQRAYCETCYSRYRLPRRYRHRTRLQCGLCQGSIRVVNGRSLPDRPADWKAAIGIAELVAATAVAEVDLLVENRMPDDDYDFSSETTMDMRRNRAPSTARSAAGTGDGDDKPALDDSLDGFSLDGEDQLDESPAPNDDDLPDLGDLSSPDVTDDSLENIDLDAGWADEDDDPDRS